MDTERWRVKLKDGPDPRGWRPLDWAFLDALLARPGVALPLYSLMDAMWTARGLEPPETADTVIRVTVARVRQGLARMGLNPDALVNDPPYAYGLNLEALDTQSVRRPRYFLNVSLTM